MPIDPSIPLASRVAPVQGPMDLYGNALQLKSLIQDNQLADERLRQAKSARDAEARALAQDDALRKLYETNPNPTQAQVIGVLGPDLAAGFFKAQALAHKEQLEAAQKQSDLAKSQAQRFYDLAGTVTDAGSYQRAITAAKSEGLLDEQSANAMLAAPWNEETQASIGQFRNFALTEMQRRELEDKQRQAEFQRMRLAQEEMLAGAQRQTTERGQDISAETARAGQAITAETAKLDREQRAKDAAANRSVQVRGQNMSAQTAREGHAIEGQKVTAAQNKTSADFKKQDLTIKDARGSLKAYREALDKYGPIINPRSTEGTELGGLYTDLQMQMKNLYQLGALTGPDMQVLEKALADPTSLTGKVKGKKALKAQLDVVEQRIARAEKNLREVHGQPNAPETPRNNDPLGIR